MTTREKILKKAFEQFVNNSYDNTSIDQIAQKAGVSKGAIFHYFETKEGLALESLFTVCDEEFSTIFEQAKDIDNDRKKFRKLTSLFLGFFENNPKIGQVFIEIYEKGIEQEKFVNKWLGYYKKIVKLTEQIFENLGFDNVRSRSYLYLGVLDGLAIQFLFKDDFGDYPKLDDLVREICSLFLGGEGESVD